MRVTDKQLCGTSVKESYRTQEVPRHRSTIDNGGRQKKTVTQHTNCLKALEDYLKLTDNFNNEKDKGLLQRLNLLSASLKMSKHFTVQIKILKDFQKLPLVISSNLTQLL